MPDCLRRLKLVTDCPGSPELATAVPPEAAAFAVLGPLEDAIAGRQKELHATKAVFAAFSEIYTETRRHEQPPLTLLTGGDLISKALEAAVNDCRNELLTAQPGGGRPPRVLGEALERDLRLLSRGVSQQTIYQHTVRSHQATMSYIEQITDAGAEVRTLTEVFERMIICDRKIAFIPVSEERGIAALQIRHPALVRLLSQFFDNAWARSIPVHPDSASVRSPTVTSDVQRAILQAVVSGETDDTIARRLGMSRRSVAEHLRKVSQRLGSSSRAQLGYLLATSGLLEPAEPTGGAGGATMVADPSGTATSASGLPGGAGTVPA
ncbi:LuxR C-terminal-related transcriptional regulator [Streptomyces sp. NPDC002889]|uniref:LuxR C-terminal-related transcriptional regulator n=1 Tax=Streptomyces sp. NPDC002889 TaxID=3364669 RepID=UPI003678D47E